MESTNTYNKYFNFLYDYINITNKCIKNIDFNDVISKIRHNVSDLIYKEYLNITNKDNLYNDLTKQLKKVSLDSLDYIYSRELPNIVISIMINSMGHKYPSYYLNKFKQDSDLVVLTRNINNNKVKILDANTILFDRYEQSDLSFTITREGYLNGYPHSIKDITYKRWRLPYLELNCSYKSLDSLNFNGSKILSVSYNTSYGDPTRNLVLESISTCQFETVLDKEEALITPKASVLLINNKNSNYVEFRELIEYCVLSYIPNLSKTCSLVLVNSLNSSRLLNFKGSQLKTKYAEKICDFVNCLQNFYGWFNWNSSKILLNIKVDDKVITPIDKVKLLGKYKQKYGSIEDMYKLLEGV